MPFTDEGRRKAAKARKGHHLSAATRKKISIALKGKHHKHKGHAQSAATRAKISKALTGKRHPHRSHPLSAAARAKIAASLKMYWDRKGRNARHASAHGAHVGAHRTQGLTNAQVLGLKNPKTRYDNATVLSIKKHRNIHGRRLRTNRRVVNSNVHR